MRRVATDVFAAPNGRAAARCGEASSTPRASPRPAELPEPDKRVPTPVIAAAELRAVARTAMSQVVVVVEGQRLGTLVCYEILFPQLARELVHEGAGLFVNLSNDSRRNSIDEPVRRRSIDLRNHGGGEGAIQGLDDPPLR